MGLFSLNSCCVLCYSDPFKSSGGFIKTSWRARRCSWKKMWKKKKLNFFFAYNTPGHPWASTKNASPIGPAVWPAKRNIFLNVLFYFIDGLGSFIISKKISNRLQHDTFLICPWLLTSNFVPLNPLLKSQISIV